ncbi:hypothetical protein OF83DRAFT_245699 [Amylostereum chailletii]|nr:hypothetical protein OF83DRAFT_245699 [Amylostereum chailletii]
MAGSFAALMAQSQLQTKETTRLVQDKLAERLRKEEERKRQQEVQERKDREIAARLRQQHFEEKKKEQERQERLEKERAEMEQEEQRRKQKIAEKLLYGKKPGGSRWPTSSSSSKQDVRQKKVPSDEEGSAATALTREEKRALKLKNEFRIPGSSKRSSTSSGYGKLGKRLPGGAVNIVSDLSHIKPSSEGGIRDQILKNGNHLILANTFKRDTTTVAERQDMRYQANIEAAAKVQFFSGRNHAARERDNASKSRAVSAGPGSDSGSASQKERKPAPPTTPATSSALSARIPKRTPSMKLSASTPAASSSHLHPTKSAVKSNKSSHYESKSTLRSAPPSSKKRTRSPSYESDYTSDDISPPPRRKQKSDEDDIRSQIWTMFGKDRSRYVARDVMSDDEDMEMDARELEREELRRSVAYFPYSVRRY